MQFSKDDATFEIRATHKVEGRDGQNESFERTVLDPTADGKGEGTTSAKSVVDRPTWALT